MPNRELPTSINIVNKILMKKIVKDENKSKSELWFDWLTRKLNSYEVFKDFALGQNPEDVAENFVSVKSLEVLRKLF